MSNLRQFRKRVISRENAEIALRDFYPDFVACVQHGVNQIAGIPARQRAELSPRSMAACLNDFIVKHAIRQFSEDDEVRIDDSFDGTFLVIRQQVALRFKKVVGRKQTPSNYPTKRQTEISWQQGEFDGFPNLTVVNLGYELNSVWTEVKSVSLTCRRGPYLEWSIPIAGELHAYMFDTEGNVNTAKRPRVRAKYEEKAEQNAQ